MDQRQGHDRELYRLNKTAGPVHGTDELCAAAQAAGFTVDTVGLRPIEAGPFAGQWEFVIRVTEWPSEGCDECGQMVSPITHAPVKGMPGVLQCL